MVHTGPLVDVILGAEYQHFDVGDKNAFCFGSSGCGAADVRITILAPRATSSALA